ncbi:thioredoxin family protein [Anianabacter salinae]|uniref:thioredoxin family protein n=1 Tax=Anianabacter salinae TaxID=2851023 RepID=UPI00225E3908|nr:thioredoxin family protein [Anianabacter salinae]MBV0913612.1 thioredoxin family protein [Anianabacter salinae]
MNRRSFLATTAAALVLAPMARAEVMYTPGLVDAELAAGKTVFLDYAATWCTTCAAQERVINALKSENPAYEQNVSFIKVDWDTYSRDAITTRYNVPRRSTLIVLKGDQELGRIVAETSRDDIKALMDTALNAATTA